MLHHASNKVYESDLFFVIFNSRSTLFVSHHCDNVNNKYRKIEKLEFTINRMHNTNRKKTLIYERAKNAE